MENGASFIDLGTNSKYRIRQNRQGEQGVQSQQRRYVEHVHDHDGKTNNRIYGVHHGRTNVHSHLGNIFADAVHQISRSVLFVEILRQVFVLPENLVFQIEFDVARHHDKGLSHQESQETRNDCRGNYQEDIRD